MVTTRFVHLQLRTNDVDDARSFYESVLGPGARDIAEMPEQARARGAPAHWLGHLQVEDVDHATAAFVKRGALPLGPKRINEHGFEAAVMREPGGALVDDGRVRATRASSALAFHFAVPAMDAALAAVRRGGGYVVGPFEVEPGDRLAVCDDSQSAAFAIRAP